MRRKPKRTINISAYPEKPRRVPSGYMRKPGSDPDIPADPELPQGSDFSFDPDVLTYYKYGRGMTHDRRYRPASSQSVSDFGNDMGGGDAVIGESSFLGEQIGGFHRPGGFNPYKPGNRPGDNRPQPVLPFPINIPGIDPEFSANPNNNDWVDDFWWDGPYKPSLFQKLFGYPGKRPRRKLKP